jgi:predicted  nucleic acid-binding Zn-ribbon protein
MTRCPSCNTEYDEALAACPNCGAPAEETVQCTRCGQEYVGGDSCPSCGLLRAEVACENHPAERAVSRCVLCGRPVCKDCTEDEKQGALCEEHRTVSIIEGWAQVYSTTSELEAQLLRENLRADGIEAQVYSQKDMMFNLDLGELSIVRLLVPVWEYGQAMTLIHDHMDVEGEVAFACTACGEAFEAGARECTSCGAALV